MPSARVTGLLLAAGGGRRYGMPKALVDDGSGPWVLRSVRALLDGGCGDVLVVTGAAAEEVETLLGGLGDDRVAWSRCGTWEQGMGESLRAGLTALATRGRMVPVQALVHLVDLPDVGAEVVSRVLAEWPTGAGGRGGDALVRAAYGEVPGHPVLMGQRHWQAVLDVARGDAGARAYLRRARPRLVECGDLARGHDVDVPAPGPAAAPGGAGAPHPPDAPAAAPGLIALDVDRTLMTREHPPHPATLEALAAARAAGTRVALASGRDPHALRLIATRIGLPLDGLLLIGRNGSQVVDAATEEVLWSAPLDPGLVSRVERRAAAYPGVSVSAPAGQLLYSPHPDGRYVRTEAEHNDQDLVPVASLGDLPRPVTKVLLSAEPARLLEVADEIADGFAGELTFAFSTPFYLEATAAGVDKGTALVRVCERLGIDPATTVAFGDQANDIPMLRAAGLGVAVGNAVPETLEAADVVIGDFDTDAIALLLRGRYGL